jgi:hypothetical protein
MNKSEIKKNPEIKIKCLVKKKGTKPNKVFGGPNSGSLQEHHAHAPP